ncbi:MAG: hypothetical protein ACJAXZ_002551 [Akkermansiaceae bacterium]
MGEGRGVRLLGEGSLGKKLRASSTRWARVAANRVRGRRELEREMFWRNSAGRCLRSLPLSFKGVH